jgi:Mycolic acid cyclopropane synthetase
MSLSWRSSPTLFLERYPLFSQAAVLYIAYRGLSTYLWPTVSRTLLATLSSWSERLVGLAGYVPTPLVRWGIRIQLRHHLQQLKGKDVEKELAEKLAIVKELTDMPIAICTNEANVQHYEVPAAFYDLCLGPCKKYSSGYWPDRHTTFAESERHMLQLYCDRAGVTDTGLHIVDLGCGWGSLTLYLAEQYPTTKITAISNSHSQREYILRTAKERNLNVANIQVVTVRGVRAFALVEGWLSYMLKSNHMCVFFFRETLTHRNNKQQQQQTVQCGGR